MKNILKKSILFVFVLALIACSFLFSGCSEKKEYFVDKTSTYFMDGDASSLLGIRFAMFIDTSRSTIVLNPDGTICVTVILDDNLVAGVPDMLTPEMAGSLDLDAPMKMYVEQVFPGFTLDDIPYSFSLMKNSLGLSLYNVDEKADYFLALEDYLIRHIPLPADFALPTPLGVQYNGTYYLKEITSEVTGETYTGIYVDKHDEDSDSFIIMTLSEDKKTIDFSIEFLQIIVNASK